MRLKIDVAGGIPVSGLLLVPSGATACYVMAHGAGAGMTHAFMEAVAEGLAERNVATLRYQFPYMERATSGLTALSQPISPRRQPSRRRPL